MRNEILFLSSQDRLTSTDDPGNCSIRILPQGVRNLCGIRLIEFTIPNVLYNIRSGVNDRMVWNRSSTNYSYVIPQGQYTISTLLSTIETGMNGVDANSYDLTHSLTTYKTSIAGSGTFILNWATSPFASTSCWRELGWTSADVATGTSHTSPNCFNMTYPTWMFIQLDSLPIEIKSSSISTSHTLNFPVLLTNSGGSLVSIGDHCHQYSFPIRPSITLSDFRVRLLDQYYQTITCNGIDWSMVLEVQTE